jgi:hypothetical protein
MIAMKLPHPYVTFFFGSEQPAKRNVTQTQSSFAASTITNSHVTDIVKSTGEPREN